MSIKKLFKNNFEKNNSKSLTIDEYLNLCKTDHMAYASAPERMIAAIGEPELIDTSKDERLSRIFHNRTIRQFPAFKEFYGMEDAIERIVGYFSYAAQGLEERKQILYLLGPVGGGKSSLAERLKELMEIYPIYVLSTDAGEISPVFESPLGLFSDGSYDELFQSEYGIQNRYLKSIPSPWAVKRLKEFGGDIDRVRVVRLLRPDAVGSPRFGRGRRFDLLPRSARPYAPQPRQPAKTSQNTAPDSQRAVVSVSLTRRSLGTTAAGRRPGRARRRML